MGDADCHGDIFVALVAMQACIDPVSRSEFTWIDLAVTSLLANWPFASESGHARDQCLRAAVTPQVNLSFSFVSRVPRHLIYIIAIYIDI